MIRRSVVIGSRMPGRCTLTTASRPSCSDAARGPGRSTPPTAARRRTRRRRVDRAAEVLGSIVARSVIDGERWHVVEAAPGRVGERATGNRPGELAMIWPELHERRPEADEPVDQRRRTPSPRPASSAVAAIGRPGPAGADHPSTRHHDDRPPHVLAGGTPAGRRVDLQGFGGWAVGEQCRNESEPVVMPTGSAGRPPPASARRRRPQSDRAAGSWASMASAESIRSISSATPSVSRQ